MAPRQPSLRARFGQLVWARARRGWIEHSNDTGLGLLLLLDYDTAITPFTQAHETNQQVVAALERLSELPNVRVLLISAGTIYGVKGRDVIRMADCAGDAKARAARTAIELSLKIVEAIERVLLHISGDAERLTVGDLPLVFLRIGQRREGADYVLPSVPALIRFLAFLEGEFRTEAAKRERSLRNREQNAERDAAIDAARREEEARRPGFASRLDAARTTRVDVQLGPAEDAAVLWRGTVGGSGPITREITQQIHLQLPSGHSLVGEGDNLYDALCSLRTKLYEHGTWLRACGNCEFFASLRVTHEFSGGKKGYCTLDAPDYRVVSILDICRRFRHQDIRAGIG